MIFLVFTQPSGLPLVVPATPDIEWTELWGRPPVKTLEVKMCEDDEARLSGFLRSINFRKHYLNDSELANIFLGVFSFLYQEGIRHRHKQIMEPPDFVVLHPATCSNCGSPVEFYGSKWNCAHCKTEG